MASDVGPLLAVHLDTHEIAVQEVGDFLVLERLALHDVAPVARTVADGEEDDLILFLGLGEGLVAPGIPVHGVMGVLEEVGTRLAGQVVGRPIRRGDGRRQQDEGRRIRHGLNPLP